MAVRKCYWPCPTEGRRTGGFFCDSHSPTVQCPFLLILSVLHGILCPPEPSPSPHLSCFYPHATLSITLMGGPGPSPCPIIPVSMVGEEQGTGHEEDLVMLQSGAGENCKWEGKQGGSWVSVLSVYKGREDTNAREMHSLAQYHASQKGSTWNAEQCFFFKYLIKGFIESWISARITMSHCYRVSEGGFNLLFSRRKCLLQF